MANVVGMLEIQMAADLARLSKDMSSAQATVSRTVSNINNILGTIGVGLSVDMFASMIKGVVDAGDRLNDLRKISSLTVEELGGLGKAAKLNGSNLEDVAKAIGIMNGNVAKGSDAFARLSINTKTSSGDFRQSRDILLDVADRFSTMRDGVQKAAIAQEIFGKSGRELIPLLNEGRQAIEGQMEAYAQSGSMTTRLAEQSDQFNDILTVLNGNVTATKNNFVSGLLPALIDIGNAFTQATGSATLFSSIGQGIGVVLKGIVIAVATAAGTIKSLGIAIDGIARQFIAITNLDFSKAMQIGDRYFKSIDNNAKGTAEFIKTIVDGDKEVAASVKNQADYNDALEKRRILMDEGIKVTEKYLDPLIKLREEQSKLKELLSIGAITEGTYKTAIAQTNQEFEKRNRVLPKVSKSVEKQNKEYNIQLYLLKQYEEEAKRARDITESVATEQEIYNKKLEELNRLKPYLTVETYDRALAKLSGTTKQVAVSTKSATDEVSQLWMQAGRNIQSSLADGIFNFFDNGLKGMVKSVISTVGRIMSEFAALKIAQSVGLASMFSGGLGGKGGSGALNLASMGSNAMSMFKGGFGIPSLLSNAGSMLPGSAGAFFGGMGGTGAAAASGAQSLWGASGLTGANALGASVASFAGPAVAVAAVDQIVRMLAGDKKLGGLAGDVLNFVPVLGPLINGLFGRGPLKQKETTLSGSIGQGGFESGSINTNFVAKGGLFRSDKNDFARVDAVTGKVTTDNDKLQAFADSLGKQSRDIIDLFNETATGVSGSLKGIGKNLGISTESLNSFNREINLVSEKGKFLTEEQISAEIAAITDQMVTGFLPAITDLAKRGETSAQAIQRINGEFNALTIGAQNLGMSVQGARDLIMSMSIEARTAFVDQAGGIEKIAQETSFFFQNFLSESEQLALKTGSLSKALIDLGLSADLTRDQFAQMIMSTGTANDLKLSLLELAPAFNEVKKSAATVAPVLGNIFQISEKVNKKAAIASDGANLAIQAIGNEIQRLQNLAGSFRDTINSINPMSLDQALSQLKSGNSRSSNLQDALATVRNINSAGFSNVLDFQRSKGQASASIGKMANRTAFEIAGLQESMASFDVGGVVPRTGVAMIHKNEQIFSQNDSASMSNQIEQLTRAVEVLTIANNRMNRRFDKWDNEGLPAERVA